MKLRLPELDSSTGRGIKSGMYAALGTIVTIFIGLIAVIKGVPGCPEAIIDYAIQNAAVIAGLVGISSGTFGFLVNVFFRKDVKNY